VTFAEVTAMVDREGSREHELPNVLEVSRLVRCFPGRYDHSKRRGQSKVANEQKNSENRGKPPTTRPRWTNRNEWVRRWNDFPVRWRRPQVTTPQGHPDPIGRR